MSQSDRILEYLKKNGSITQMEATYNLGCTRLSARIFDLRAAGNNIVKTIEKGKNKFGDKISYARFYLV